MMLIITSSPSPRRKTLPVLNKYWSIYENGHCSVPKPRWILRTILCVCWSWGRLAAIAEEYVSSSTVKKENVEKVGDFESLGESEMFMSGQVSEGFSKSTKYQYDNG